MRVCATVMAIGVTAGLALVAASAGAQDDAGNDADVVIVTSPPPPQVPERSAIGAPTALVSLSQSVRIDDLDLRTESGARDLRNRVSFAARTLCNYLRTQYPASFNGVGTGWPRQPDCFRAAVDSAMPGAEAAIESARAAYGGR